VKKCGLCMCKYGIYRHISVAYHLVPATTLMTDAEQSSEHSFVLNFYMIDCLRGF
jgi:hypothetical protein